MILSFAWTTPAVVIGQKCVTRREWTERTIKQFEKAMAGGTLVEAWDKNPRFGGKCFGMVRITGITRDEDTRTIPEDHFEAEGFHILTKLKAKLGKLYALDLWAQWKYKKPQKVTVVCFDLVSLNEHGVAIALSTHAELRKLDAEGLNKCALCGKFMSDDDVLLGYSDDGSNRFLHYECGKKMVEVGTHEETAYGIAPVEIDEEEMK